MIVGEEVEQRLVAFVRVRPADVVLTAFDRDQREIRDEIRQPLRRRLEREDPVLRAARAPARRSSVDRL
jgi:hypothetical protein